MSALLELGAGFHPELSGRENVYLNGVDPRPARKRELDRRFDDIVEFAGLERFIDSPVKNYSSGMYVRLGFSVAINVDPDMLLIDEVLAVGDEEFQRKCLERVADLRRPARRSWSSPTRSAPCAACATRPSGSTTGVVREAGKADEVADAYLGTVHVDHRPRRTPTPTRPGASCASPRSSCSTTAGGPWRRRRTGDTVTFRLHYEATEPVTSPVFSFAIHTPEGVHVTGPNTKEAGVAVDRVEGSGHVDLHVDRLMLLLGSYDLSAECTNDSFSHTYHQRHRALRFDVKPGSPHETFGGLMSLGGRWAVDGLSAAGRTGGAATHSLRAATTISWSRLLAICSIVNGSA